MFACLNRLRGAHGLTFAPVNLKLILRRCPLIKEEAKPVLRLLPENWVVKEEAVPTEGSALVSALTDDDRMVMTISDLNSPIY